jgi:hypothetical protein
MAIDAGCPPRSLAAQLAPWLWAMAKEYPKTVCFREERSPGQIEPARDPGEKAARCFYAEEP